MPHLRCAGATAASVLAAALLSVSVWGAQNAAPPQESRNDGDKKPSLSLRANPPLGFSPLRVRVVAELKGGADDFADLYCASVEWDWGDGTVSENSEDCDPYEAGKSQIRRRFTADHTYRSADAYRLSFRLKQKNRVVASSQANIQVRPGIRDLE